MSLDYASILSAIVDYHFTFYHLLSSILIGFLYGYLFATNFGSSRTPVHSALTGDVLDINDLHAEYKMVLIIRSDLDMSKGKIAAQCSHATLANYKAMLKGNPRGLDQWERTGQAKITLKCEDELQLLDLQQKARKAGLCARSIQDAGRTQIAAGSTTVLAIGPGSVELVNNVTGHLKLY
ncbi:mitochondrial peptidyl-tRNA hydrolase 2 [Jimgerdemannia flammicorona]|uniref:peptidyl-tRNA hydrolase n=1 Tax=Jimgerdemannia flammicorona TaxID=994334 RepID=A0A433DC20_9FUNG|nr:mitochondrial peptidyl-tRNA hydrolase 2 [Jimgerdemannia flammicorona]